MKGKWNNRKLNKWQTNSNCSKFFTCVVRVVLLKKSSHNSHMEVTFVTHFVYTSGWHLIGETKYSNKKTCVCYVFFVCVQALLTYLHTVQWHVGFYFVVLFYTYPYCLANQQEIIKLKWSTPLSNTISSLYKLFNMKFYLLSIWFNKIK